MGGYGYGGGNYGQGPYGGEPPPAPLVPNTIQPIFQALTIAALGLSGPSSFVAVRIGWQTSGQPAWGVADNIVVVMAVEEDNPYNRVRDVQIYSNDDASLYQLTTYTRVWRVSWTFYGPTSFDSARILKSSLFQQGSHDTLAASNLYLVTDTTAPQRVPEYFEGLWYERVDFSCLFNEFVQESLIVPSVESVEIIVNDAKSSIAGTPLADFTVSQGD